MVAVLARQLANLVDESAPHLLAQLVGEPVRPVAVHDREQVGTPAREDVLEGATVRQRERAILHASIEQHAAGRGVSSP